MASQYSRQDYFNLRNTKISDITPTNVLSGFKKSIYPFEKTTFSEEDFISSYMTDRPESQSKT